jgi:hypothetical protein
MWGYRKVRKADIPQAHRDVFERYGESVMQMMIAANFAPRAKELSEMYSDQAMIENAGKWLTERADKNAKHEWRIEIVEWAILIFVIVGVAVDLYILHATSH